MEMHVLFSTTCPLGIAAQVHALSSNKPQCFGLMHMAFPFNSHAQVWFEEGCTKIEQAAAQSQAEYALLDSTLTALSTDFCFLSGDKEQRLYDMELQSGEDVADCKCIEIWKFFERG